MLHAIGWLIIGTLLLSYLIYFLKNVWDDNKLAFTILVILLIGIIFVLI